MGAIDHRHLHHERSRHGKMCVYVRLPGKKRVRVKDPEDPESIAAAFRAARVGGAVAATPKRKSRLIEVGTLDWLCASYFGSAEFARLGPKTRQVRRGILDACCAEPWEGQPSWTYGQCPIGKLKASDLKKIRDRKVGLHEAANGRLKALRAVLSWGAANDDIPTLERNVGLDVAYIQTASTGHHTWSIEEVQQYEAKHPLGSMGRMALALLLYTGQRRSDVVYLGRQHVKGGWLSFTQVKNAARKPIKIDIPVLPELTDVIAATQTTGLAFIETEFGRPFTANGFGARFRKWCDDAELPHCSAHGLRKAGATIAAENGATEAQLMAIFGWATLKEASRYTRAARRKKLAGDAMGLLVPRQMGNVSPAPSPPDQKGAGTGAKKAK